LPKPFRGREFISNEHRMKMINTTSEHLQAVEEIELMGIAGLVAVLQKKGIDGVRYAP
jgi:hypothetical protein